MFCPACGVKNEPGVIQCFVCKKGLPSLDAPAPVTRPRRLTQSGIAKLTYGSIGDRFLALVFDRIILAALLAIAASLLANRYDEIQGRLPSLFWTSVSAGIAFIVLVLVYHIVFEAAFGSTLGKAILGLHVRSESDRGRLATAAIRNVLRLFDSIGFYAFGFFIALFSAKKQRLGDHVAGTVVLEEPIHWAGRVGLIVLLCLVVLGALWTARYVCPACYIPGVPLRWPH